jgi:hypothetical protein
MKLTAVTFVAVSVVVAAGGAACDRKADAAIAPALAPAPAGSAGPSADTANYKVEVKAVGTYKKGQAGTFEIVLKTKGDYHVNDEYPTKFKAPEKPENVTYGKELISRAKDADAWSTEKCASGKDSCTLKLTVPVTPTATGSVKLGGTLHFGVCNAATCLIEKQTLELPVTVAG